MRCIFDRVAQKRLELSVLVCHVERHESRVIPRGGVSTFESCGLIIDGIRGEGTSDDCDDWCHHYGLNLTVTYSVALYGMELATQMATAWCHKTNYFWDIWVAFGRDLSFLYQARDAEQYEATPEWSAIAAACRPTDKHYARVQALRDLRPRY